MPEPGFATRWVRSTSEVVGAVPVVRYSEQSLSEILGESFELREVASETHVTPSGKEQEYLFLRFSKRRFRDGSAGLDGPQTT